MTTTEFTFSQLPIAVGKGETLRISGGYLESRGNGQHNGIDIAVVANTDGGGADLLGRNINKATITIKNYNDKKNRILYWFPLFKFKKK